MTVPNNANTYLPGTIAIPSSLVITAITQTYPMVVTCVVNATTEANTYIPGQLVSLFVPYDYGMWQANGLVGQITAVNGLNFSLDIDATQFDPFVVPSSQYLVQPATMAPAGSRNLQFDNSTNQIGFQSLNNRGN